MRRFFNHYQSDGRTRSYIWMRKQLQTGGLLERGKRKEQHRKKCNLAWVSFRKDEPAAIVYPDRMKPIRFVMQQEKIMRLPR
jgi:hypothetical protein